MTLPEFNDNFILKFGRETISTLFCMGKNQENSQSAVSQNDHNTDKPVSNEEISSLIQAFEYFAEHTDRLRESYDKLQEQLSVMDLELTKKNDELDLNLQKMDTIKNHLENILESMSLGVVVLNLEGTISIFNQAASEITGFTPLSMVGKPYADTLGKKVPIDETPLYTLHEGRDRRNREKEIFSRKNKPIPVEYSTSLVTNELGETLGVVEIFSDLRDMKKLQEEVQQSRTLAALGEMAGHVAHELRNPLGGIGGFAALLDRDLDREDPRRKLVQKIIEGVSRINKTATNLLVYTRPMRPKKRPEDIIQVVDNVLALVQVELEQDESNVEIVKEFKNKSLNVPIDPELLEQVLLNILKNAVQAMSYNGKMTVGIKHKKNADHMELYVRDTGSGIPDDDKKKLFLPFFTTKADGTGLGLSIVKKIIDTHEGTISVENNKQGGSTFSICLPM